MDGFTAAFLVACGCSAAIGCIAHAAWSDYRERARAARRHAALRRRSVLRRM